MLRLLHSYATCIVSACALIFKAGSCALQCHARRTFHATCIASIQAPCCRAGTCALQCYARWDSFCMCTAMHAALLMLPVWLAPSPAVT
eukprot:1136471-Pelagomonas_calceolata.AAC.13